MKHVTPSEARKNWFKLLDEASNGESIAINRNGKNLILRLETPEEAGEDSKLQQDYPDTRCRRCGQMGMEMD